MRLVGDVSLQRRWAGRKSTVTDRIHGETRLSDEADRVLGEDLTGQKIRAASSAGATLVVVLTSLSLAPAAVAKTPSDSHSHTVWHWLSGALPALATALAVAGIGLLLIAVVVLPLLGILRRLVRRTPLGTRRPFRWLTNPLVQVQPFDDSGMGNHVGAAIATLAQARVGGGREAGLHLYLVTGEQPVGGALAALQAVPETKTIGVALALLTRAWGGQRLVVSGALLPIGTSGAAALAVSMRRNSKFVATGDFWPTEAPVANMTVADTNRVLAVAAAGWIEHHGVDQTPGPSAREVFYSGDARSWGLFRAGAELQRMSCLSDAANAYEQALALDGENVGALVDLAHLRRREEHFRGAMELVDRALELIQERNTKYGRSNENDPDWYRACIVRSTVQMTWASSEDPWKPPKLSADAYDAARMTASAALRAGDELSTPPGWLGPQASELKTFLYEGPVAPGALVGVSRPRRARELRRARGAEALVEFQTLLATTFEPGALLLVAGTGPNASGEPPAVDAFVPDLDAAGRREWIRMKLDNGALARVAPDPLVGDVTSRPVLSPRVEYNVACYYSRTAQAAAADQLEEALNFLRRSISRTAPLERRGLYEYALRDPDLQALRDQRRADVWRLRDLVPPRKAQPSSGLTA